MYATYIHLIKCMQYMIFCSLIIVQLWQRQTCLNVPIGHATDVKQTTMLVHVATHTIKSIQQVCVAPHWNKYVISHTLMLSGIFTHSKKNNLKALTHQRHGNGPRTSVGDCCTPITKRNWNSGFLNSVENMVWFMLSFLIRGTNIPSRLCGFFPK